MKITTLTYDQLAPSLRTGDIVLQHGLDEVSQTIQLLTGSTWSHVSIVVLSKDLGIDDPAHPILLWESTPMIEVVDETIHKPKAGPTLVDMKARLLENIAMKHDGAFAVRHFYYNFEASDLEILKDYIATVHDDTFPTNLALIADWVKGRLLNIGADPAAKTYFCSELISETFMVLGLLPTMHPDNYYDPADFSSKVNLPWLKRAYLGNEILFTVNE
ncbi:MAG: hypothetical protein MUE81_17455 [Thermoflexibacter sp.]|jgi:hypothetical protein|nr:hypothetical protein [Thermoflexibacter sp.]